MFRWSHLFVGRNRELAHLQAAYAEAREGKPRVVALVSESGFGKTRLVQEFYNWLSTHHDLAGGEGYWPDHLLQKEDNLAVNPDLDQFKGEGSRMPFLWWAIRLSDPGERNALTTSAMWAATDILKAHLAWQQKAEDILDIRKDVRKTVWNAGKDTTIGVGFEAVNSMTFGLLGIGKSVLQKGLELEAIKSRYDKLNSLDASPLAHQQRADDELTQTILADLRRLSVKPVEGFSPIPLVIVIDDAHWLEQDKGVEAFLEALSRQARRENWPLLIVLTSWQREWRTTTRDNRLPGALIQEMSGDVVLALDKLPGLEDIVRFAFPGLTPEQRELVLDKGEGNPLILQEFLKVMERNPGYFLERDRTKALNATGVTELTSKSFTDFVEQRFYEAPEYVRKTLGLASEQGMVFSGQVTEKAAEHLGFKEAHAGLQDGVDPHGYISLTSAMEKGEFRIRAYQRAARQDVANFFDSEEVQRAMSAARSAIVDRLQQASVGELTFAMASSNDTVAIRAAAHLIWRAIIRHDLRAAGEISAHILPRLKNYNPATPLREVMAILEAYWEWHGSTHDMLAVIDIMASVYEAQPDMQPDMCKSRIYILQKQALLVDDLKGPEDALPLQEKVETLARAEVRFSQTPENIRNLIVSLSYLGATKRSVVGLHEARPHFEECEQLAREIAARSDATLSQKFDHLFFLDSLAFLLIELEELQSAKTILLNAHAIANDVAPVAPGVQGVLMMVKVLMGLYNITSKLDGEAAAAGYIVEAEGMSRYVAKKVGTPISKQNFCIALQYMGDHILKTKGPREALKYYQESADVARDLARSTAGIKAKNPYARALSDQAGMVMKLEGPVAARPLLQEAEAVLRGLMTETDAIECRQLLCTVLTELGRVAHTLDGIAPAIIYYREAAELAKSLSNKVNTPGELLQISGALTNLGTGLLHVQKTSMVKPMLYEAERFARKACQQSTALQAGFQLARVLQTLGDVAMADRKRSAAKSYYDEAIHIIDRMNAFTPDPGTESACCDMLGKMGDMQMQTKNLQMAKSYYKQALTRLEVLHQTQGTLSTGRQMAVTLGKLGHLALLERKPYAALAFLKAAKSYFDIQLKKKFSDAYIRSNYAHVLVLLARLTMDYSLRRAKVYNKLAGAVMPGPKELSNETRELRRLRTVQMALKAGMALFTEKPSVSVVYFWKLFRLRLSNPGVLFTPLGLFEFIHGTILLCVTAVLAVIEQFISLISFIVTRSRRVFTGA